MAIINPNQEELITMLKNGAVGVMPTDTVYGILGKAQLPETVERIYDIKKRDRQKALVVLISAIEELKEFGVELDDFAKEYLAQVWPGKVSVVLKCDPQKNVHLHRGLGSIAFRLPDKSDLIEIIKETGPLVAPSANPESQPMAKNIEEAKNYFGDQVDFYVDGGELTSPASKLVMIENGGVKILR